MRVENENDAFVVIAAVRYALKQRKEYGVDIIANTVKQVWNNMDYNDRALIRMEIRKAIESDPRIDGPRWKEILTLPMERK